MYVCRVMGHDKGCCWRFYAAQSQNAKRHKEGSDEVSTALPDQVRTLVGSGGRSITKSAPAAARNASERRAR